MNNWQTFEINCTYYLQNTFGEVASFIHCGGSNSKIPDIKVIAKNQTFFIESKMAHAQCGQFVLLPDSNNQLFKYSPLNSFPINEYSLKIIQYMNRNFTTFQTPTSSGIKIHFKNCENLFANWICNFYKSKNVKFVITEGFKIVPIDKFYNSFDITATYRIKRSGSRKANKKDLETITAYLIKNIIDVEFFQANDHIFIKSSSTKLERRFTIDETEYYLSTTNTSNVFEIRKLSNTSHANVIFSIALKKNICGLSNEEFKGYLI